MTKKNGGFCWKDSVALKDYFDTKIDGVEKATTLAAISLEKRLEGMNEFRDTLKDQASRFITRTEHEASIEKFESDIRILRESKATLEGKASQNSVLVSFLIGVSGVIIAVVSLVR